MRELLRPFVIRVINHHLKYHRSKKSADGITLFVRKQDMSEKLWDQIFSEAFRINTVTVAAYAMYVYEVRVTAHLLGVKIYIKKI